MMQLLQLLMQRETGVRKIGRPIHLQQEVQRQMDLIRNLRGSQRVLVEGEGQAGLAMAG